MVTHIVYNVFLGVFLVSSWHVNGADDVHLVVLERYVSLVHVNDVICVVYPESETDTKEDTTQENAQIHRHPFTAIF